MKLNICNQTPKFSPIKEFHKSGMRIQEFDTDFDSPSLLSDIASRIGSIGSGVTVFYQNPIVIISCQQLTRDFMKEVRKYQGIWLKQARVFMGRKALKNLRSFHERFGSGKIKDSFPAYSLMVLRFRRLMSTNFVFDLKACLFKSLQPDHRFCKSTHLLAKPLILSRYLHSFPVELRRDFERFRQHKMTLSNDPIPVVTALKKSSQKDAIFER